MDHLGERLSALVDGELGHADRDKALNHLAACEACRFEADTLRRLKQRLHRLDAPEPSTDFMGRLSAMSAPPGEPPLGPPPSSGAGGFGSRPPIGSSRPIGGGPSPWGGGQAAVETPGPGAATAARSARQHQRVTLSLPSLRPRWGRTRYALAGASVVAMTLGTAFVAGGESGEAPAIRPALHDYAAEHAVTAQQSTLPDPSLYPNAGAGAPDPDIARAGGAQPR